MNVGEVSVGSDVVADARRRFLAPVRICKGARTGSELLITGEDFANGLPTVEELPLGVAVISTVSPRFTRLPICVENTSHEEGRISSCR